MHIGALGRRCRVEMRIAVDRRQIEPAYRRRAGLLHRISSERLAGPGPAFDRAGIERALMSAADALMK